MKEFIEVLFEFFKSDFAKDYRLVIIALLITCAVVTAFVVSVIFNKIILPYKLNQAGYIMPNYQNALAENEELREDNIKLKDELNKYKRMKDMIEAADSESSEDSIMQPNDAFNVFLTKTDKSNKTKE